MIVTTPETTLWLAGEVMLIVAASAAAGATLSAAINTNTIALNFKTGICHCARPAAITQNSPATSPSLTLAHTGQRAQRTEKLPFDSKRIRSARFSPYVLGEVGTQGTQWISIHSLVKNSEKPKCVPWMTRKNID
jgi:hypothetical protein